MTTTLLRALAAAVQTLDRHSDELTRLDSLQGDGDLGRTAGLIAEGIRSVSAELGDADIALLLRQIGVRIAATAPSSSGTLIASAFLGAGKSAAADPEFSLARGLSVAVEAVQQRGKARPGDRTMLDAAVPALVRLEEQGDDFEGAARAAEAGIEATRTMEARTGRARFLAGNAVGEPDPGAVMVGTALAAALRATARG